MTGTISADDRALIERTRSVNKTLSLFVFALQERGNIPADSQVGIAAMLDALADTIRERASQPANPVNGHAVTTGLPALPPSSGPTVHLAAAQARQGVQENTEFSE